MPACEDGGYAWEDLVVGLRYEAESCVWGLRAFEPGAIWGADVDWAVVEGAGPLGPG